LSVPGQPENCEPVADSRCAASELSPLEDLSALRRELRALVHDQLKLAALEVRLAGHSLMTMISAAVCIAALLVMAWLGLMGAAGLSLVGMGLQPAVVLLVLVALTLVPAGLLRVLIRRRSRDLGLPASLRALQPPAADDRNGKSS
jgi:hypothetical protein